MDFNKRSKPMVHNFNLEQINDKSFLVRVSNIINNKSNVSDVKPYVRAMQGIDDMIKLVTFYQIERSWTGKQLKTNNVANEFKQDWKRSFEHL